MRAVIHGSGTCIAPNRVTNQMLARIMDTSEEWILARSGVETRYYVDPGTGTSDLAVAAARQALEMANLQMDELDLVVFATMTPDHYFPGSGGLLAAKLGIRNIPCFDIRQQCVGFLYGLQLADAHIRCGMARNVLLVGPAGRSYYHQLLAVGIRIFEYLLAMLHAKTMVIDERLALVGSANIDIRSFRLNFEVGALIDDIGVATILHERFISQLRESTEIDLATVQGWSFPKRLQHGAARVGLTWPREAPREAPRGPQLLPPEASGSHFAERAGELQPNAVLQHVYEGTLPFTSVLTLRCLAPLRPDGEK